MDTLPPAQTNVPEYTVSEIAGAVKRTLEGAFGRVRVRGELVEVKRYSSGHTYLCLKDEGGTLRGIIWKTALRNIGLKPEDGVEVIATGRITAYGDKSQYQIIIEHLEYAGAGAMLARIEALRIKLAAEGLFQRRRTLPVLPGVVGVVTSPSGAVLHDIHTTIARRFGRPILLWPVRVQGEGAAEEIAAAIAGFGTLPRPGVPRPDVLIVARGGGSLEDLMAFNDEAVVRAAAACAIPLISAVGHETDHTLIDLAADRRAPTPTAAAEMAVPVRLELLADLQQRAARQSGALARMTGERRMALARHAARLPDVQALAATARQRLDDRVHRLDLAVPNLVAARRAGLADGAGRLRHGLPHLLATRRHALVTAERHMPPPGAVVTAARHRLATLTVSLPAALRHAVQRHRIEAARTLPRLSHSPVRARLREMTARLEGLAARLAAADPRAVLARGYALVTDAQGKPVTSAAAIRPAARLQLEFADGAVTVQRVTDKAGIRQGELSL
jgi:exodeoxyribonuclease VII large subunit